MFRLVNRLLGVATEDIVTVTRAAAVQSPLPALDPVVSESDSLAAVVSANATQAAAVVWEKKEGPGAAFFANRASDVVLVTFSQAGTYTLTCTATGMDGRKVSADISLTVGGGHLADSLTNGLAAYWPMDYDLTVADSVFDGSRNLKLFGGQGYGTSGFKTMWFVPGVGGGQGLMVPRTTTGNFHSELPMSEGGGATNDMPAEDYFTFSGWMYHDGSHDNGGWMGTLFSAEDQFALLYHYDGGTANDIEIFQYQTYTAKRRKFAGPTNLNFSNRWIHVVAQVNQRNNGESEVWVNGEKLAYKSGDDLTYGRYIADGRKMYFGGQSSNTQFEDADPDAPAGACKSFPGALDEIRIYRRKLSAAEIRFLYEYPVPRYAQIPPESWVASQGASAVKAEPIAVSGSVAADVNAAPVRSASAKWTVGSGDASQVSFADVTSPTTSVTFAKKGRYVLQLIADDGVHTTYSNPVVVDVAAKGFAILFR